MSGEPSTVLSFLAEIQSEPEKAILFVESLSKILLPWEPIQIGSAFIGETTVPAGQTPAEFKKNMSQMSISGYILKNVFSTQIAVISKDHPKWKVYIDGVQQTDAPMISHGSKAEQEVKGFVEKKLLSRGFILSETKAF